MPKDRRIPRQKSFSESSDDAELPKYQKESERPSSTAKTRRKDSDTKIKKTKHRSEMRKPDATASGSDSDGEIDAVLSPMKQPSLIKQLRGILSEYPDGGQIIKELIQNAEDAGATEVKILFDGRSFSGKQRNKLYSKFFRVPSLCVYNDAVFTETDWEGIQMICSSNKEKEKTKVGRFGLGFKSVFHLTDYPCILSGDRLLMMDPQQPTENAVNAMMVLNQLDKYKGMDKKAFMKALNETFGLNEDIVKSERGYPGTLFWFPLRDERSELSETLYDEKKVMALFDSFRTDASNILIFLRNVSSISLHRRTDSIHLTEIAKVELVDNQCELRQKRKAFQKRVQSIDIDYSGESIFSSYTVTVESYNCLPMHFNVQSDTTKRKWQVVNLFMGKNASVTFQSLIRDPSLGYIPYASVAAPFDGEKGESFEGHVFCFLPLPKEGSRLTGLPIHVNGYFALSQNRHHLKWATDDQAKSENSDKCILWNERLIAECLPHAFGTLVKELVNSSKQKGNPEKTIDLVYRTIPNHKHVVDRWKDMVNGTFAILKNQQFLYTVNIGGRGEWITLEEATFATLKRTSVDVKCAVVKALRLSNKKYVDVPYWLFETLEAAYPGIQDLTPDLLRFVLHQNDSYKTMTCDDKILVASYVLSDNGYKQCNGLELIPLDSGAWIGFEDSLERVYLYPENTDVALFPGKEQRFVLKDDRLASHFKSQQLQDTCQVRHLSTDGSRKFIDEILTYHFRKTNKRTISLTSSLNMTWLKSVWEYLDRTNAVSEFSKLTLLPILETGSWPNPKEVKLVSITDFVVLRNYDGDTLSAGICSCLKALSVNVAPSLPTWIPISKLKICLPRHSLVMALFSRLNEEAQDVSNRIACFNGKCRTKHSEGLIKFLNDCSVFPTPAKELITKLKIFQERDSLLTPDHKLVCLKENKCYTRVTDFPVRFPRRFIKVDQLSEKVLNCFKMEEFAFDDLVLSTLKSINNKDYTEKETMKFMDYFMTSIARLEENETVLQSAKSVPFLRTVSGLKRPSEVFNPHDLTLCSLFGERSKYFPEKSQVADAKKLSSLQILGLKSIKDLTAENLLQVATTIDTQSRQIDRSPFTNETADAFLNVLNESPNLLKQKCQNGEILKDRLNDLECIICVPQLFSECLPLFSSKRTLYKPGEIRGSNKNYLVGSTMPIVTNATELVSNAFGWDDDPPMPKVIEQLELIKTVYTIKEKTHLMVVLKSIYQYMNKHKHLHVSQMNVGGKSLIWNGNGFSDACNMIALDTNPDDLDLRPYFYTIPEEFCEFNPLFKEMGCKLEQNGDILLETLSLVQKRYMDSSYRNKHNVKKDLDLTLRILEKLVEKNSCIVGKEFSVLFPIESNDNCILVMKPVQQCTLDKLPPDYDLTDGEEPVFTIHSQVPAKVAKALGVLSFNLKSLDETEEFEVEEWGQEERLTTRLRRLLKDSYVDGFTVIKELIQNADDACASTVKFLYDERENKDAMKRLLCYEMKECQGPALWSFNDARFSKEDLENITKLNGATKEQQARKIGKFGLGFCSVYNLTDVPSFVTGSHIVFFDPHKTYLSEALPSSRPGLKIDLSRPKNKKLLATHEDQFKPYLGVFDCDLTKSDLNGTLFRFPLRTLKQSKCSDISSIFYSKKEMQTLLTIFMKNAGNLFLFTQNIQKIEIYHVPANGSVTKQTLLFSAKKQSSKLHSGIFLPTESVVLPSITSRSLDGIHKLQIDTRISAKSKTVVPDITKATYKSKWLVSWTTGIKESLDLFARSDQKGAFPIAAVAVPLSDSKELLPIPLASCRHGFHDKGTMFCFLPLPITTKLQMHINACFDVTSNRRQLLVKTPDDKGQGSNEWNEALMADPMVNALINLLLTLSQSEIGSSEQYIYHSLWPTKCSKIADTFRRCFFREAVEGNYPIFKTIGNKWSTFGDVHFLDPYSRQIEDMGNIAYDILSQFQDRHGKTIIRMPKHIMDAIHDCMDKEKMVNIDKQIIKESDFLIIFLQNVHDTFWTEKITERDGMILEALNSDNKKVMKMMRETKCIPTGNFHELKEPSDLVDPTSSLSGMFLQSDGRFPNNEQRYRDRTVLRKLRALGMMDTRISDSVLLERCTSLDHIGRRCCECAFKICTNVIQYITKSGVHNQLKKNEDIFTAITNTHLLPVLSRPKTWQFPWRADTCSSFKRYSSSKPCRAHGSNCHKTLELGKSTELFSQNATDFVGSVQNIVDEEAIRLALDSNKESDFIRCLGVKGDSLEEIPATIIIDQVNAVSINYHGQKKKYDEVKRIYERVFNHIQKLINRGLDGKLDQLIKSLNTKQIVLIGKELVLPEKVAFHVRMECAPDLRKLPISEWQSRKVFYAAVGVRTHFTTSRIVSILKKKQDKWKDNTCNEIDMIKCLLENLQYSMTFEKKEYKDMVECHDFIVAPDVHCVLRPTHELVIDPADMATNKSMKIIHETISPLLAKKLGAKSKKRKCLENITIKWKPFGQKESLVTRLKGLLEKYPCDENILKELLQNADDAGATEVHFIKDFQVHPTGKLFNKKFKSLQGPALCVFNNSYFTQDDLDGIQQLGEGSKREDASKAGQYGIGFNVVYHLTDVPSFITKGPELKKGGVLCILDPLLKCVPHSDEPGAMFEVDGVEQYFPNILSGFMLRTDYSNSEKGTMFRFPLRTKCSNIKEHPVSEQNIDELLSLFKDCMFETLIFLKNVNCVKISKIECGILKDEYVIQASMSEGDKKKREHFYQQTKSTSQIEDHEPMEIGYEMTITDSIRRKTIWYVTLREFEIDECSETETDLRNLKAFNHLPLGGVAMPIVDFNTLYANNEAPKVKHSKSRNRIKETIPPLSVATMESLIPVQHNCYKVYCTLPLPEKTGFPLHVNGHFILQHEARREIEKERHGKEWNQCIANHAIAQTWISAVTYLQKCIVRLETDGVATHPYLFDRLLEFYNSMFPFWERTTGDFWKDLVRQLYKTILKKELTLFPIIPVVNQTVPPNTQIQEHSVRWTAIGQNKSLINGVFNELHKHIRESHYTVSLQEVEPLTEILTNIGMKILQASNELLETLKRIGENDINTSSPAFVVHFLKSFEMVDTSSCYIGRINTNINQTTIKNVTNLKRLVSFMLLDQDQFYANIEGLPILLTQDNVLRKCVVSDGMHHSEYCQIFPKSGFSFVHLELLKNLDRSRLIEKGIFTKFDVQVCLKLLPDSYDINVLGQNKIISWKSAIIPKTVICKLFSFLVEESLQYNENKQPEINTVIFKTHLDSLGKWSLFPTVYRQPGCEMRELVPLSQPDHVLYRGREDNKAITSILDKINLPTIDLEMFKWCMFHRELLEGFDEVLASCHRSSALLKCLSYHKGKLSSCGLTCKDGLVLLSYFASDINTLSEGQTLLRSLPLYETQQATLTSIDKYKTVMVLPIEDMPICGMEQWTQKTNILVLKRKKVLDRLYEYLYLQTTSVLQAYANTFIPSFAFLPQNCWIPHIKYLRDFILPSSNSQQDADCKALFESLKDLAFIRVNGQMKRADECYCHLNPVFKSMMDNSNFLPQEFRLPKWRTLLVRIGLIVKPDDKLFIDFAKQIQRDGCLNSLNVAEKAKTLTEYFIQNHWKDETKRTMRTIRFVVPHKVSPELSAISKQHFDGYQLISYEGSVSSMHQQLCWTNSDLLPQWAFPSQPDMQKLLGIHDRLPVQKVASHCQNICEPIQMLLKSKRVDTTFVTQLFECIYMFLNSSSFSERDKMKSTLEHTPIVYLNEDHDCVKASEIVINLSAQEEIKPFLFRAPLYYGKFHELFVHLGSAKEVSCMHYAAVLCALKTKLGDEEMMVTELNITKKCLTSFFHIIENSTDTSLKVQSLFLPDRNHVLMKSTSLTVSNNVDIENRLRRLVPIDFFVGFHRLTMDVKDPALPIRLLPQDIRPEILSEIVSEKVCLDDVELVENTMSCLIERFVHSTALIQGILRLLKHQLTLSNKMFTDEHIQNIKFCLKHVKVLSVTGLKTILCLRDREIQGTEETKSCFVKETKMNDDSRSYKQYTLYLQIADTQLKSIIASIMSEDGGLIDLIDLCTDKLLQKETTKHLPSILSLIETPHKIMVALDKKKIDAFDLPQGFQESAFPKPGTRVEDKFHSFLDQSITLFNEEEYTSIALVLEDTCMDINVDGNASSTEESVFIYVHIRRLIPSHHGSFFGQKYEIDTGDCFTPYSIVPIYRLYRFVRADAESDTSLLKYDDEPTGAVAFDENCRRIREMLNDAWMLSKKDRRLVIMRILLKWHPDRNPEHIEYSSKIFNYANDVISRLKQKIEVPAKETVSYEAARSVRVNNWFHNRITVRARAYRDNTQRFNREYRTGNYVHMTSESKKIPDYGEAKQWLRQAKNDYLSAVRFNSVADDEVGYNWICYTCHQACEKALKAAQFSKDATVSYIRKSHCLTTIASNLTAELKTQAQKLENLVGEHTRMRYPNTVTRDKIPSDIYMKNDADASLEITKNLIGMAEEFIYQY